MAQKKINPIAFRLSTKQTWWTVSHSSHLYQDLFVRKLIKGMCKAFNIFTSEIGIKRKNNLIFVHFLVYPYYLSFNSQNTKDSFLTNINSPHIKLPYINTNRLNGKVQIAQEGIMSFFNKPSYNYIDKNKTLNLDTKAVTYLTTSKEYRINYVISLLEAILNKRFEGHNKVKISITHAPSLASNAHLFSEWLKLELKKNPLKHKQILNRAKQMYIEYQKSGLTETKKIPSHVESLKKYISL